jgi:CO dehydrogenase maturation factor
VISDSSVRSIRSAGRVKELIESLQTKIHNVYLVITKIINEKQLDTLMPEIEKTGLDFIGYIPMDEQVMDFDLQAKPLFDLSDDSKAVQSIKQILDKSVFK